jgi:hypothetical protein
MYDVMVSGEGELYGSDPFSLMQALEYPHAGIDLRLYAIRNLGWIRIQTRPTLIRLQLRPMAFTRAAYETAVRLMTDEEKATFVFDREEAMPVTDVVRNFNDAVAHLEDLMSFAGESSCRATFFSEALSLGRLRHPKRRVLRDLAIIWKRAGGLLADDLLEPFREVNSRERFVLVRTTGRRGTIQHFGHGITCFGATEPLLGRDIEDQPDPVYGENTARGFHEVHLAAFPRLELVDSVIRPPGRPVQRARYDRLLLPWRAVDGSGFVSSTSILRTRFCFASST